MFDTWFYVLLPVAVLAGCLLANDMCDVIDGFFGFKK